MTRWFSFVSSAKRMRREEKSDGWRFGASPPGSLEAGRVSASRLTDLAGTTMENVVPLPSSDAMVNSPPMALASLRQMESPSPVPPALAFCAPTCTKGEARRFRSAAHIPQPESCTARVKVPASPPSATNEARNSTNPCLVNLTALPTRLKAICLMRCGSSMSPGRASARKRMSKSGFLFTMRNDRTISSRSFATSVGSGTISILPDSSFERSRMSFTSWRSVLLPTRIESTAASCSSFVGKPAFSSCEKPMMALSGVRMSWLTDEKKRLLARACWMRSQKTALARLSFSVMWRWAWSVSRVSGFIVMPFMPAEMALSKSAGLVSAEMPMNGSDRARGCSEARKTEQASMPLLPGMLMSVRTRSTLSPSGPFSFSSSSSPSHAVTHSAPRSSTMLATISRAISSSSARSILKPSNSFMTVSLRPGRQPRRAFPQAGPAGPRLRPGRPVAIFRRSRCKVRKAA